MKNNIKRLRKERGLTLKQVGESSGVSKSRIQEYETGKHTPSIKIAFKIARFFNLSVYEVFDEDDLF